MLRKNEAYRDVYLFEYKVDDSFSGEILELLLSGICPVCDEPDEELQVEDFGSVGEEFNWVCENCHASVTVNTTR